MANKDIYKIITDQVISELEKGTIPWQCCWRGGASSQWPMNFISKKEYRGANVFLLIMRGHSSRYWLTAKQAEMKGGHIRKGEKCTRISFMKFVEKTDKETGEIKTIPFLRYHRVFNLDQIEGIDISDDTESADLDLLEFDPIDKAEGIIEQMPNRPVIRHDEANAYYRPSTDVVNIPSPELFFSSEEYYSTAFHELVHSTGHEKRLGRAPSGKVHPYGGVEYSKEELVAELGSAFLCAEAGISQATIKNSASYINGWLDVLRHDSKVFLQAGNLAQKAVDYVLNRKEYQDVKISG